MCSLVSMLNLVLRTVLQYSIWIRVLQAIERLLSVASALDLSRSKVSKVRHYRRTIKLTLQEKWIQLGSVTQPCRLVHMLVTGLCPLKYDFHQSTALCTWKDRYAQHRCDHFRVYKVAVSVLAESILHSGGTYFRFAKLQRRTARTLSVSACAFSPCGTTNGIHT